MLSRAQNTFHHNPRLRGPVSSLIEIGAYSLVGNYLRPSNNSKQLIFNINAVGLIVIICYYL